MCFRMTENIEEYEDNKVFPVVEGFFSSTFVKYFLFFDTYVYTLDTYLYISILLFLLPLLILLLLLFMFLIDETQYPLLSREMYTS